MKVTIWTKAFWMATLERVLATAAQAGIAYILVGGTTSLINFNWGAFLGVVGVAALLALLKCLAANAATKTGPSVVNAEQVVPPEPQPVVDR